VVAAPKSATKEGLWSIFFAFFIGFAALLTPCVLMIPMTVDFFKAKVKQSEGISNAIVWVSIIVIYVLLGF
jgi:thiol:disulfide interchange protein